MNEPEKLIPPHGGYRKLKSFQLAQLAYDVTARFCDRYIDKRSRTHDQMVQAARSGVQIIAEGIQASGTSKKTELKLTNVARASLEELRMDYEDYLRQRGLGQWVPGHPALALQSAALCHARRGAGLGRGRAPRTPTDRHRQTPSWKKVRARP
jgi:four helix bundle protein